MTEVLDDLIETSRLYKAAPHMERLRIEREMLYSVRRENPQVTPSMLRRALLELDEQGEGFDR